MVCLRQSLKKTEAHALNVVDIADEEDAQADEVEEEAGQAMDDFKNLTLAASTLTIDTTT